MGRSVSDVDDSRDAEIAAHPSSRRHGENAGQARKVGIPPRKNLLSDIKDTAKEIFLDDEPLRHFKGQSKGRKIWLGFQSIFPILHWAREYKWSYIRGDLIAGLTIASLCIPQVTNFVGDKFVLKMTYKFYNGLL